MHDNRFGTFPNEHDESKYDILLRLSLITARRTIKISGFLGAVMVIVGLVLFFLIFPHLDFFFILIVIFPLVMVGGGMIMIGSSKYRQIKSIETCLSHNRPSYPSGYWTSGITLQGRRP